MTKRRKTLVIGAKGFLGKAFYEAYQGTPKAGVGTHYKNSEGLQLLDLRNPNLNSLKWNPKEYSHALILAGVSDMWKCEREKEYSYQCNVLANLSLAKQCIELGIVPILFSTDYVFDGKLPVYTEESLLSPLNEYGKQRADLEMALQSDFKNEYLLLRLSKVLSFQPEGRDALTHMIQRFIDREKMGVIWDQTFCPILITDVILAIEKMKDLNLRGLFNLAGSETWSRIAIYRAIAEALQLNESPIELAPIEIAPVQPLPSLERPSSTVLSCLKFQRVTQVFFKPISESIEESLGTFLTRR